MGKGKERGGRKMNRKRERRIGGREIDREKEFGLLSSSLYKGTEPRLS